MQYEIAPNLHVDIDEVELKLLSKLIELEATKGYSGVNNMVLVKLSLHIKRKQDKALQLLRRLREEGLVDAEMKGEWPIGTTMKVSPLGKQTNTYLANFLTAKK